jgi:hypothetical protein
MAIYKIKIPSYSLSLKNEKTGEYESKVLTQNETFDDKDVFPNDLIYAKGMTYIAQVTVRGEVLNEPTPIIEKVSGTETDVQAIPTSVKQSQDVDLKSNK